MSYYSKVLYFGYSDRGKANVEDDECFKRCKNFLALYKNKNSRQFDKVCFGGYSGV